MTNSPSTANQSFLVAVVLHATENRDLTISNIKQIFSMKPAHWTLAVQVVGERKDEATLRLIDSLGLPINTVTAAGNSSWVRVMKKVVTQFPQDAQATLWVGSSCALKSDAFMRIEEYRKQYPNGILVGQFLDEATGLIGAGGYRNSKLLSRSGELAFAETLPRDVVAFDDQLVLIPKSASDVIGQRTSIWRHISHNRFYVSAAKAKRIGCFAIPGYLGTYSG
jgi:hypothetical protein